MKREKVKLEDIVKLTKGKKHSEVDDPNAYRYLQIEDLHGSGTDKYTNEDGVLCDPSDLLIAWDGANAGKVGTGLHGMAGSTLARISVTADNVSSKYLYWYLSSNFEFIKSKRTGATIPHVNGSELRSMMVPLPPLHIQEQIADTMDKADALRRKDQELLQKYEELAQAIFYDMFGDPVRNDKGWEVKKLGDLCNIKRGASPRPIDKFIGHEVPWIKIGDATKGDDMFITKTKVHITKEGSKKSILVRPDDLIFANCGVSLGFARISKITGCIHDGWLAIEIKNTDNLNQVFLLKLINALTIYLRGLAPEGTQPNLNIGIMKTLEIIVPPITLQRSFNDLNKQFYLSKINIESEIKKSYSLFDNISNLVFS